MREKKITSSQHSSEEVKRVVEKSRASKQEVMQATKRGIDKYRDTLKNLAKR